MPFGKKEEIKVTVVKKYLWVEKTTSNQKVRWSHTGNVRGSELR